MDKVPIVSSEYLDAESVYPKIGVVACQIIGERTDPNGKKVVTVDTRVPWAIYSEDDETKFDVYADQLEGIIRK